MKITLSVLLIVIALTTPASMMTNVVYQKSRAMERVVNALQVLSEDKGYSPDQRATLTGIQSELFTLFYSLAADVEPIATVEEYEQARALQRALSIMFLTADISGLTEEQIIKFAEMRTSALAIVREIKTTIGTLN